MAEQKARGGELYASADGAAWTKVGGVKSVSSSYSLSSIDSRDFDSGAYEESEYDAKRLDFSAQYHRDEADAGQDIIRAAVEGLSSLYLRHRPTAGAGFEERDCLVRVDSLNDDNSQGAMVISDLQAHSTGTITVDTQA